MSSTTRFTVSGLTSTHGGAALAAKVRALPGVGHVTVIVVPGEESAVTVTSDEPLDPAAVRAAIEAATG